MPTQPVSLTKQLQTQIALIQRAKAQETERHKQALAAFDHHLERLNERLRSLNENNSPDPKGEFFDL